TCSRVVGAEGTLIAVRDVVASRKLEADVLLVGCSGLCYAEPLVEVQLPGKPAVLHQEVTADRVPALLDVVAAGTTSGLLALAVAGEESLGEVPPVSSLPFWRGQVRRLMAQCGVTDPENIDHYITHGGYEGLDKSLRMDADAIIKQMLDSGLWGRGGAAFPPGRKWDFLRTTDRRPKYRVANAAEGHT